MKNLLLLCFLLINPILLKLESKSNYDYSSYQATKNNENLTDVTISSSTIDNSVVYITEKVNIKNSILIKESGNSSNIGNSDLYGVNAAVLVQNGDLDINEGEITTKANGASALVATNEATVKIRDTIINSTNSDSSKGLLATYGGSINARRTTVSTQGESSAAFYVGKEQGTIDGEGCTLNTKGKNSPLIYSTGNTILEHSSGIAEQSKAFVVDGKGSIKIEGESELKCNANPITEEVDQCAVMIYQNKSMESFYGIINFEMEDSSLEILNTSKYYKTAPMFFVTNTIALIFLSDNIFIYGSKIFLSVNGTKEFGDKGKNGGNVTLSLKGQNVEGDFIVDETSYLYLYIQGSVINGKINPGKTAKKLFIHIDSDSKINLTGNSYYTEFHNDLEDGSNLINGSFSWIKYEGSNNNSGKGIFNSFLFLVILSVILL